MLWDLATFVFLSPSLRAALGNLWRLLTLSNHNAAQGASKLQNPEKDEALAIPSSPERR